MIPAPGWKKPGDIVYAPWKVDLLRYLGSLFKIPILVETGTCEGATIVPLHDNFQYIYSVELSPYYYEKAVERTKDIKNIYLSQGNSVQFLKSMLYYEGGYLPHEPILFWLDAHSSGGLTADEGDPLPEELRIITACRPDALIVIDDMGDAELTQVKKQGVSLEGWYREYRTGEIIMHKGGYIIPPFEEINEDSNHG